MIHIAQLHLQRLDRAEGVRNKACLIGTPLDDIDFLVVQFMHDIVNARTAYAYTRTNGVQALLPGHNRHFRAATRFAGDALDLYCALVDLRHFRLKQAAHQIAVGARDEDLQHAARRAPNIVDIDTHALPGAIAFVRHFFAQRHQPLHVLGLVKVQQPATGRIAPGECAQADLAYPVF